VSLTRLEERERGGGTELCFFRALQAGTFEKPAWYRGLRHATLEEDRKGVDAFAELDTGVVPIQIKSSHAGLRQHLEQYGEEHLVIVIGPFFTPEQIQAKTLYLLYVWRGKIIRGKRKQRRA
jgi:hypothetical protein